MGIFSFTRLAPQFGQPPTNEDLERLKRSANYGDGAFVNQIETTLGTFTEMAKTMPEFLFGKNKKPQSPLPVKFGENTLPATDSTCFITWFGHSAFLLEMEGKRILIDPMLSQTPAPVPFGTSRFPYQEPIPVNELNNIDFVIISHDHYDHLDYKSIILLKERAGHFYTPLGVGSHLKSWGIPEEKITELDWWEGTSAGGIELTSCPARHFSGRGISDRNATQWASWVIKGKFFNIYFSGDSGYGPHFREIGEKLGPFDLSMVECGQYNLAWHDIHMLPEESTKAGAELNSKIVMPIHWGAFSLSTHTWKDPVKRFQKQSENYGLPVIHPLIGERFNLGVDFPLEPWWTNFK